MSLIKEVKSENGVTAVYHRIGGIQKNAEDVVVIINSYTEEAYRILEKEKKAIYEEQDLLLDEFSWLTAKTEKTEEEINRFKELASKMKRIKVLSEITQFVVFETKITLKFSHEDSISFQDIYTRLKNETEMFRGAADCY